MKLAVLIALASITLHAQNPDAAYQHARELIDQAEKLGSWRVKEIKQALDQAKTELTSVLQQRPGDQAARIELAHVQNLRGDHNAALDLAQKVLRDNPKNLDAQLTRAKALLGLGKPGVARLFLVDALQQYPDNPEVLFNIGEAAAADRLYPEASDAYRKLWQLEPAKIRGLEGVAKCLIWSEQPDAALRLAQTEAARSPDRADIQVLLGRIAFELKRYKLAVEAYQAALKKSDKPTAEVWGRLAEAYQATDNLPAAIDAFKKAGLADPDDPKMVAGLAMALDTGGFKDEAAAAYRTTIKLAPNHAQALNNLAYLLADTGGDLTEALDLAQRAQALLTTNPEIADTIGWVYFKSSKLDKAIGVFQDLVNLHPSQPAFHYHLGLALAQKGDTARALAELKKALAERPPQSDIPKIRESIRKLEEARP